MLDWLFLVRDGWLIAFPLVWLGIPFFGMRLSSARRRGELDDAAYRKRFFVLWVSVVTYTIGAAAIAGTCSAIVRERVDRILAAPHSAIGFLTPRRLDMRDPALVQEFLALLRSGHGVSAHHSHPENEIEFSIAGDPRVFTLGGDSQVADEYWLELKQSPIRGEASTPELRHFRSPALTAWLVRHRFLPSAPVGAP